MTSRPISPLRLRPFLFQHCPHSTTQRFNNPHRIAAAWLAAFPRLAVGMPVTPLVCYLLCDGLRFCLPRRNQSTQQPSQDRTLLGTPPPLDLHPLASLLTAAPLSLFSLHASQQSARTLPNLKCLFLTVAAVSTRRRSSAHQGHDEPRDGT